MTILSLFNSLSLENDRELYCLLANKRIFITGGTGFFGKWLLLSLCRANDLFGLNTHVQVLSRNPRMFLNNCPFFNTRSEISFLEGDILSFDLEKVEADYVIHAATEASVKLNRENPKLMYQTCVDGAEQIIKLATFKKGIKKILFTSSGAVYGEIPSHLSHVPETYVPQKFPTLEENAYMLGKIHSERMLLQKLNNVVIARCFAFVGPFLPLDAHFAIGNFIGDVLNKREIIIQGDGTALRSYLYASDLVSWLLTMLLKGENGTIYNVGSEETVSIRQLAEVFLELYPETKFQILKQTVPGTSINRYIPSTKLATKELGLTARISLREGIGKTVDYYRLKN